MKDGEVVLTYMVLRILHRLLETPDDQIHGYSISKQLGFELNATYMALARLKKAGWIESFSERVNPNLSFGVPRKFYKLTILGRTRARASLAPLQVVARVRAAASSQRLPASAH